jgi:glucose-1-phosphatase
MGPKISVIVFDLGNVLLPFDYKVAISKLEKIEEGLGKSFIKFYDEHYEYHRAFERGDMQEDEFIKIMLSALNNRIDSKTFCEYYSDVFSVNNEVAGLIPWLKQKYMMVLLTNTNSIHFNYGWKQYDFLKYFDKIVTSYEAGAVKPEKKIYMAVQSFTKKEPGEHFFIDDIAEYTDAAKSLGWDAIQYKSYKNLIDEFNDREIW